MSKTASRPAWQLSEFDKPLITASYFGFTPIVAPRITEVDLEASRHCMELPHYDATEKAALIRTYLAENLSNQPHPLALIYKKPMRKPRISSATSYLPGYSLH